MSACLCVLCVPFVAIVQRHWLSVGLNKLLSKAPGLCMTCEAAQWQTLVGTAVHAELTLCSSSGTDSLHDKSACKGYKGGGWAAPQGCSCHDWQHAGRQGGRAGPERRLQM